MILHINIFDTIQSKCMLTCKAIIFFCICFSLIACVSTEKKSTKNDTSTINKIALIKKNLPDADLQIINQAKIQLTNNQDVQAKKTLSILYKKHSQHIDVIQHYALVLYKTENYQACYDTITPIITSSYANAMHYNLSGLCHLGLGQISQSEKLFQQALDKQPKYYQALFNLALVHDNFYQDLVMAKKYYTRYLALIPYKDEKTQAWLEQINQNLNIKN